MILAFKQWFALLCCQMSPPIKTGHLGQAWEKLQIDQSWPSFEVIMFSPSVCSLRLSGAEEHFLPWMPNSIEFLIREPYQMLSCLWVQLSHPPWRRNQELRVYQYQHLQVCNRCNTCRMGQRNTRCKLQYNYSIAICIGSNWISFSACATN